MTATNACERILPGPPVLGLETRGDFRQRAIAMLDEMPEGLGRLVVDLGPTRRMDSAGLGALMLVQRRATERRQTVQLRGMSDEIRFLLALTKLLDLFETD